MTEQLEGFRRALEGAECGAAFAQAFGYHGQLVAPVTVIYLQFGPQRWARFGIDGGDFHWRETAAPEVIKPDGSGHTYPLVELEATDAIMGRRIQGVSFRREPPGGGCVSIWLANGAVFSLVNTNDESHVEFTPGAI
jgi:hypothetical protein